MSYFHILKFEQTLESKRGLWIQQVASPNHQFTSSRNHLITKYSRLLHSELIILNVYSRLPNWLNIYFAEMVMYRFQIQICWYFIYMGSISFCSFVLAFSKYFFYSRKTFISFTSWLKTLSLLCEGVFISKHNFCQNLVILKSDTSPYRGKAKPSVKTVKLLWVNTPCHCPCFFRLFISSLLTEN